MNVKAVFLDIDGTWYDHKTNQIFKENIEAVKKLQEKGIKVAFIFTPPFFHLHYINKQFNKEMLNIRCKKAV